MILSARTITYLIVVLAGLAALGSVMFCWSMYYPYHKMREENYRKELKVLQDLCASGLIPGEYQINSVTYGGKATNCSQAFVFTQIPIVFGALSDMWDDSLVKFIINGGNWKIQVLFAICTLFIAYRVSQAVITLLVSGQFIEQLNPGQQFAKLIHNPASPNSKQLIVAKQQQPPPLFNDCQESAFIR